MLSLLRLRLEKKLEMARYLAVFYFEDRKAFLLSDMPIVPRWTLLTKKELEDACEEAKNFASQCHDVVEKIELYTFVGELTNKNANDSGKKKQTKDAIVRAPDLILVNLPG